MFNFFRQHKRLAKLSREVEELRKLTQLDPLTGVYNRRGLVEHIETIFDEVKKSRKVPNRTNPITDFSILFLDADNFKDINDRFGHDLGDKVLRVIADVLKKNVRKLDIIGRFGGEEFVVGLVGADQEYAVHVAERIREDIEELTVKSGKYRVPLSVSVGVKQQEKEVEALDLIFAADKLMYKAKMSGKNKVVAAKLAAKPKIKQPAEEGLNHI